MGSMLGPAAVFPIVQGEPYIATVRMQRTEVRTGARVMHESLNVRMRDSAGRIRDEQLASPPDAIAGFIQEWVHVLDPLVMRDTQWDEHRKTATAANIPAALTQHRSISGCSELEALASGEGDEDQLTYEELGRRDMEGTAVVGCRFTRLFMSKRSSFQGRRSVTEMWSSPELQLVLLTATIQPDGTEEVLKVSDLQRVEPDPALFRVPPSYKDLTKAP